MILGILTLMPAFLADNHKKGQFSRMDSIDKVKPVEFFVLLFEVLKAPFSLFHKAILSLVRGRKAYTIRLLAKIFQIRLVARSCHAAELEFKQRESCPKP